jgi:hypothetical protein
MPRAGSQVGGKVVEGDLRWEEPLFGQPAAEVRHQPELYLRRLRRIAFRTQLGRERVDVRTQRAFMQALNCSRILKIVQRHVSPPFESGFTGGDTKLCRACNSRAGYGWEGGHCTRHSLGPGIVVESGHVGGIAPTCIPSAIPKFEGGAFAFSAGARSRFGRGGGTGSLSLLVLLVTGQECPSSEEQRGAAAKVSVCSSPGSAGVGGWPDPQ